MTNVNHEMAVAIYRIKYAKTFHSARIKPEVIELPKKYFLKEYKKDDPENDYNYTVRKQADSYPRAIHQEKDPQKRYDMEDRVNAIVLEEDIKNPLGADDLYYHYILYKYKYNTTWARSLGMKQYGSNTQGCYFPFYVLKHIWEHQNQNFSCVVVAMPDEQNKGEFLYHKAPSSKLIDFYAENQKPILLNAYGELMTGFPLLTAGGLFTIER